MVKNFFFDLYMLYKLKVCTYNVDNIHMYMQWEHATGPYTCMIYPKFMIRFLKNLTLKTHDKKPDKRGLWYLWSRWIITKPGQAPEENFNWTINRVCLRIVLSIISYIHYLLLSFLLAHGVISLRKRLLGSSIYQLKYDIYQTEKRDTTGSQQKSTCIKIFIYKKCIRNRKNLFQNQFQDNKNMFMDSCPEAIVECFVHAE